MNDTLVCTNNGTDVTCDIEETDFNQASYDFTLDVVLHGTVLPDPYTVKIGCAGICTLP